MKESGQIVLFQFPRTDLSEGKHRPALLLHAIPGPYDDWLICMISSQLHQTVEGFDEVVHGQDQDFKSSGLKRESVIRLGRLAVVEASIIEGAIGKISEDRLNRLRQRLANWLTEKAQ